MSDPIDVVHVHTHKYFLFETKTNFEPFLKLDTEHLIDEGTRELAKQIDEMDLYQRVEYAIMACNCGVAIKTKIIERQTRG